MCRILDNLPVAVLRQRRDGIQSTTYEHGFRVGFKGNYAGVCFRKHFQAWKHGHICVYIDWRFFVCRAKRRSILSTTTWALELCTTRILRRILLALLGLRLLQTGFLPSSFWLLSSLLYWLLVKEKKMSMCVRWKQVLVSKGFSCYCSCWQCSLISYYFLIQYHKVP